METLDGMSTQALEDLVSRASKTLAKRLEEEREAKTVRYGEPGEVVKTADGNYHTYSGNYRFTYLVEKKTVRYACRATDKGDRVEGLSSRALQSKWFATTPDYRDPIRDCASDILHLILVATEAR